MSYQFDPRPEGLHYEPFTASCCKKTMWWLRDGAPETWIDLKSVFEALGMSWAYKWRMYCVARQSFWGLVACYDKKLRETLLAPGNKMPAILGEVYQLLGNHHSAARATRALHLQWRDVYASFHSSSKKSAKAKTVNSAPKGRRKKATAFVVRQVFVLLQKEYTKPAIAKALGVSLGMVKQISTGTHPNLDADAQNAWWETFGAPKPAAGANLTGLEKAKGIGNDSE